MNFSCSRQDPRSTRCLCSEKTPSLTEEMIYSAWAVEIGLSPFNTTDSRRLQKLASIQPTWLHPGLVLRAPLHKKRCPNHPHESYKVMNPLIEPDIEREGESLRSRCRARGWKKDCVQCRTFSYCEAHAE